MSLYHSRREGGIALRGCSREKRRTDVGTTLVRRFYSDTFRVNFRGLVVFVVEFAPSFCCVPDPPRRNVVFACGYVAPFVSLKSSNFVFLLNFVVFALFFCFVFLFFFSVFSVFVFFCFRFSLFSFFFGTLSVLTSLRYFSGGRCCFGFFSFSKLRFDFRFLFCFPLFRDNGILLGGPEPPSTRRTDGSAPYAITGSYLDDASLVKFGPVGSLFSRSRGILSR